ncbi:MAG: hypothetical protein R3F11_08620 [Verrucomicrobiales bacterium]
MKVAVSLLGLLPIFTALVGASASGARTFTDDQGRTVEAELVGIDGDNAILLKSGARAGWPIAKLSKPDQAYVRQWQLDPPAAPRLSVRLFEREGIGESGVFQEKSGGPPRDIPLLRKTEEANKFRHYEADITNPSQVNANGVTVAYIVCTITPSGSVVPEAGAEPAKSLGPGKRITVTTKAASITRTKTTSLTLGTNALGQIKTGSSTSRSQEKFGGAWVRVYDGDGKVIGEAKDLHPEIERLKPAWTAPTTEEKFPLLEAIDAFEKLIKSLPKPPGLTGEKGGDSGKPAPPKPPGFPK